MVQTRFGHTRLGWFATVVGAVCLLVGLAVMIVLGPDSRFTTGPHAVETDTTAVVTAPKVITWKGLRVDVLAEVPVGKPVFVGVGNSVDVQNYVRGVRRVEVTSFSTPWTAKSREVGKRPALPGAPTALDWWVDDSAGLGGAKLTTTLPDETVSVAILAVGSTNLSGLKVTMAYGVEGGFARGLALAFIGVAGLWAGRELRLGRHLLVGEGADDSFDEAGSEDDFVYVYVDEDGVEHEISAAEAERLEREGDVEVHTVTDDDDPDTRQPSVDASDVDDSVAGGVGGVVTAGQIVARQDAGLPPPPVDGNPEPQPAAPEPQPADPESQPTDPESQPADPELVEGSEGASTGSAGGGSLDDSDTEPQPTDPEPQPADPELVEGSANDSEPETERVVYVFVDEDGVEHEVTEDELDQYEIVDEEDES